MSKARIGGMSRPGVGETPPRAQHLRQGLLRPRLDGPVNQGHPKHTRVLQSPTSSAMPRVSSSVPPREPFGFSRTDANAQKTQAQKSAPSRCPSAPPLPSTPPQRLRVSARALRILPQSRQGAENPGGGKRPIEASSGPSASLNSDSAPSSASLRRCASHSGPSAPSTPPPRLPQRLRVSARALRILPQRRQGAGNPGGRKRPIEASSGPAASLNSDSASSSASLRLCASHSGPSALSTLLRVFLSVSASLRETLRLLRPLNSPPRLAQRLSVSARATPPPPPSRLSFSSPSASLREISVPQSAQSA